ncbi:MAG TPA: HNH endonuclease signature motif containing protein, partial [Streptosporangiaceae bacterium]
RLRDYVVARDLTCRFPSCGQPAWRGDLDHTQPWEAGGLTCDCNLGALCRHHHILKQHPGWRLTQVRPGAFEWVTPTGRAYACAPASYAA